MSGTLVQTCQWLPHSSSCTSGRTATWTDGRGRKRLLAHTSRLARVEGRNSKGGGARGILQSLNIDRLSCQRRGQRVRVRPPPRWRVRHWQQPEDNENKYWPRYDMTHNIKYQTKCEGLVVLRRFRSVWCDVMVGNVAGSPPLGLTAVQGTAGVQYRFHWTACWSLWLSEAEGLPMLSKEMHTDH